MAKVFDNCGDGETYYHCSASDTDFTRDEWYEFHSKTRGTEQIVLTCFGFTWNVHDVCLNPHTTEIYRDNRSFIEIKTAQRKDGLLTVGNSYHCLSGHQDDYGGGCGCWYDGATYKTEEDAIWRIWNGSRYGKTTPRKSKTQSTRQYLIGSASN